MIGNKTYLFFLMGILFSISGIGQNTGFYWDNLNYESNRLHGKLRGERYFVSMVGIQSHFLNENWCDASIVLEDEDIFENIKAKFLVNGNELIAFNPNFHFYFYKVDKNIVKKFTLTETLKTGEKQRQKFVKLYFKGIRSEYRFFEEAYKAEKSLLVYYTVVGERVIPYKDKRGVLRDMKYRIRKSYFLYSDDTGFKRLYAKKRSLLKNMPEHKKKIRTILRQNKIKLSKNQGMRKSFALFDKAGLLN